MGKKEKRYNRICASCRKAFETSDKTQPFCKKCKEPEKKISGGYIYPDPVPLKIYKRQCIGCGKKIKTEKHSQKFCDEDCRIAYNKTLSAGEYEISKEVIFKRDSYRCIYCGSSSIEDGVKLHLEHIYPISRGGKEDLYNLATACERCNVLKNATILPEEIILRIWERNEILNEKIDPKTYEDLTGVFRRNLRMRLSR